MMPWQAAAGGGGYPRGVTYLQGKESENVEFPHGKDGKSHLKNSLSKGVQLQSSTFQSVA